MSIRAKKPRGLKLYPMFGMNDRVRITSIGSFNPQQYKENVIMAKRKNRRGLAGVPLTASQISNMQNQLGAPPAAKVAIGVGIVGGLAAAAYFILRPKTASAATTNASAGNEGTTEDVTANTAPNTTPDTTTTTPQNSGARVVAIRTVNGHYIRANLSGDNKNKEFIPVDAVATSVGEWEKWRVVNNSDGTVSFMASSGHYLEADNGGGKSVLAKKMQTPGGWEKFTQSGYANLKASNGMFVVAENGGGGAVNANRTAAGEWEQFIFVNQ